MGSYKKEQRNTKPSLHNKGLTLGIHIAQNLLIFVYIRNHSIKFISHYEETVNLDGMAKQTTSIFIIIYWIQTKKNGKPKKTINIRNRKKTITSRNRKKRLQAETEKKN